MTKIGAWLVGARGSLASTVVVGARAIAHGLSGPGGLVTEIPDVAQLPLVGLDQLVFGGWDVATRTVLDRARELATEHNSLPAGLVAALEDDLMAAEVNIREGYMEGSGPATRALGGRGARRRRETLAAAIRRLGDDLDQFRADHHLDSLVVVNVASTEAPLALGPEHEHLETLERLVQGDARGSFSPSMVYAYAALERGYPFVNFTPSVGVQPGGLQQLGRKNGVPYYGRDGKTGETLVKTALAPLFRCRNLEVLSWEGFNILGGGDGRVLSHPRHKQTKVESKRQVLGGMLGYTPGGEVAIEYVPSLGNWKTAWDHIHFRGFLGTKMTAQFIWQGCDSILAAPLVLDLIRLTEFAHRRGESGPAPQLACFFKNPMGVREQSLTEQFRMLLDYVERHTTGPARAGHRG
jgi:myo-inositol-1-phosphate synthase